MRKQLRHEQDEEEERRHRVTVGGTNKRGGRERNTGMEKRGSDGKGTNKIRGQGMNVKKETLA
jgi:hypothetical protein